MCVSYGLIFQGVDGGSPERTWREKSLIITAELRAVLVEWLICGEMSFRYWHTDFGNPCFWPIAKCTSANMAHGQIWPPVK
jgi:hypothetical protein